MKKLIVAIFGIVGIILIMGAAGTADYMVEIGQDYPLYKTFIMSGVGLASLFFAFITGVMS